MDAISGELLDYFNIRVNSVTGCIDGVQKNIAIPASQVYNIVLSMVVTQASSEPYVNNIGASCTIAPNVSAILQPTDNDFSSIYTHTTTLELPVSLVNFTVNAQQDHTALLNWSTSWERGNQKYVVERSKDLTHFEAVGEVIDVAGTSTSISVYQFVDASPYRGTSYYRLRQVDHDGSSQTFDARSVVIDGQYGVYPNPVVSRSGFTLQLDEPETAGLRLYSITGSETGLTRKTAGDQQVQLTPAAGLSPGLYILKVQERGTVREHRLMVQP
ncbi:T9SS type A sorting domain-containing protein [Spirosoma koreense]